MDHPRLGRWGKGLAQAALPLCYLALARDFGPLALVAGAALWLMGRAAGAPVPAILAQAMPLLPPILPAPAQVAAVALLMAALMPLARGDAVRDRHAILAGAALALGVVADTAFAPLAVVPALLFDRRRFLIYGAATAIAGMTLFLLPPAAAVPADFPLLLATALPSCLLLVAYVRMRRRGLWQADRHARLLAGILAAQMVTVAVTAGSAPMPALLLAAPSLAMLWPLSRRIEDPTLHNRLWLCGLAALALLRLWHLA